MKEVKKYGVVIEAMLEVQIQKVGSLQGYIVQEKMLIAHSEIDDNRVDVGDVGFMCLIRNSEERWKC